MPCNADHLYEALLNILQTLSPKVVDASPGAKSFVTFATALVKIEEQCCTSIQHKCKTDEVSFSSCIPSFYSHYMSVTLETPA